MRLNIQIEKENQSMRKEIKSLKTRNHNLIEENNNLKSYISAFLERYYYKSKKYTASKIMKYYDNKDFNSGDVYDISRGTDKEDELFDYANISSYMKSSKNTYNKKDNDNYDFSR